MNTIRIRAVGDNLIHTQLYQAAETEPGVYDFHGMYDPVKDLIDEADIAIVNQETVLVDDPAEVGSFPAFGTPKEASDALVDAGFSVICHSSNHSLDKGVEGLETSRRIWEERHPEALLLGVHRDVLAQEKIPVLDVKGVRFAFLNFTGPLNMHRVPRSKKYALDVMNKRTKSEMLTRLGHARAEADYVIVLPHWGNEYFHEPTPEVREWAKFFADAGADLIIGTHPHVVQPVEIIQASDGREVPCYFSLGNFISCQVHQSTMIGGMADVVLAVSDEGEISLESYSMIPLVTHASDGYEDFCVYPLEDYSDDLASKNKILSVMQSFYQQPADLAYLNNVWERAIKGQSIDGYAFQKRSDVTRMNVLGLMYALRGKNAKE